MMLSLIVLSLAPMAIPNQDPVTPKKDAEAAPEDGQGEAAKGQSGETEKDSGRTRGSWKKHGKNGDPRSWWNQMSEEQREEARARWQRYRKMSPDSKAEMDRRLEMLKRETEQMMLELPAEEREALMNMEKEQRDRKIHRMLRHRLKEKAKREGNPTGPPPPAFDGQPLEERLQGSKEQLEQRRLNRLQREVDRAVEEGWLGPRAAEFYRTLPPEEVEKEMMRFHKWRVLDHFERGDRWKELGIDDAKRKEITALPPQEFMEHMRQYRPKRGEGRGGEHRGPRAERGGDGKGTGRPRRREGRH